MSMRLEDMGIRRRPYFVNMSGIVNSLMIRENRQEPVFIGSSLLSRGDFEGTGVGYRAVNYELMYLHCLFENKKRNSQSTLRVQRTLVKGQQANHPNLVPWVAHIAIHSFQRIPPTIFHAQ